MLYVVLRKTFLVRRERPSLTGHYALIKNTISYHFTLFIFGGPCHLYSFKQCSGDFIFLWEQLVYSVMEKNNYYSSNFKLRSAPLIHTWCIPLHSRAEWCCVDHATRVVQLINWQSCSWLWNVDGTLSENGAWRSEKKKKENSVRSCCSQFCICQRQEVKKCLKNCYIIKV